MAFKMKGHTLPGINQRSEGNTDLPDGRSGSSPFQEHNRTNEGPIVHNPRSPAKNYREPEGGNQAVLHNRDYPSPEHTARHKKRDPKDSKSPAKCPLIAMAPAIIGAIGAMKKKKEE